jgi:signal transduction histidine kinase
MRKRARTFVFLLTAAPFAAFDGAVLLAGWIVVGCLAITPLVVPALIGFRAAVGALARVEAWLANSLLGTDVHPAQAPRAPGFWGRAGGILRDRSFWREQIYLLQRCLLGFVLAVGIAALFGAGLGAIATPIDYRWTTPDIGDWHVRSFGQALLWLPPGLLVLALAVALLGPLGGLWQKLASLLGPAGRRTGAADTARRRRALVVHATVLVAVSGLLVLIWGVTTGGYFWPRWSLLPFALVLASHAWIAFVGEHPDRIRESHATTATVIAAGIGSLIALFLTGVWGAAGGGYFWPAWAYLGLAIVVGSYALIGRKTTSMRRIATLESTRAGAVDQQDSELRRIERDLHDGAQATLVALGMSLGMAEQKLTTDPVAAQTLLAEARRTAYDALEELRDLARGIHPPVLADRGLEAAVSALASRSPLHVAVNVDLPARPRPGVETAAYFVAAEALANIGKHAAATRVEIDIRGRNGSLAVKVEDDGRGGANPEGSGLRGLARRVEALDGTLAVSSPPGGPTTLEAVIPCAW